MARPSILEAVERKRRVELPAASRPVATPKVKTERGEKENSSGDSRAGKTNISGYFPAEVKASLRLVQAKRGGKVQELLAEALNLLFAKYNVPETAPTEAKAE